MAENDTQRRAFGCASRCLEAGNEAVRGVGVGKGAQVRSDGRFADPEARILAMEMGVQQVLTQVVSGQGQSS